MEVVTTSYSPPASPTYPPPSPMDTRADGDDDGVKSKTVAPGAYPRDQQVKQPQRKKQRKSVEGGESAADRNLNWRENKEEEARTAPVSDTDGYFHCIICSTKYPRKNALLRHFNTIRHKRREGGTIPSTTTTKNNKGSNISRKKRQPTPTKPAWFFDGSLSKYINDPAYVFNIKYILSSAGFDIQLLHIENTYDLMTHNTAITRLLYDLCNQAIKIFSGPIIIGLNTQVLWSRNLFHMEQENTETNTFYLRSYNHIILTPDDVIPMVNAALDDVLLAEENAETEGSTHCSLGVEYATLRIIKYQPLVGKGDGGHMLHKSLPHYLSKKKKSILNIRQDVCRDDWETCNCLLQYLIYKKVPNIKNPDLSSSYGNKYIYLNLKPFNSFPLTFSDFELLETLHDISINVYCYEEVESENEEEKPKKHLLPVRISKRLPCMNCSGSDDNCPHTMHLLLLKNYSISFESCANCETICTHAHTKNRVHHYVLIKSLYKFLNTGNNSKKYICPKCFSSFSLFTQLKEHYKLCFITSKEIAQVVKMPTEKYLYFKQFHKTFMLPFVCFIDFEAFLKPINLTKGKTIVQTDEHIPCLYSFVICNDKNEIEIGPVTHYNGTDPKALVHNLIDQLLSFFKQLCKIYKKRQSPLIITPEMEEMKDLATNCSMCKEPFLNNSDKVYNHFHKSFNPANTAKYLQGITCRKCNLQFKPSFKLPCLLHNFGSYDSHFIVGYLKKYQDSGLRVDLLAKTTEKFISIKCGPLEFKDSMSFLSGSLDACSSILKKDQYKLMKCQFPDPKHFKLIMHKLPFPYKSFKDDISARTLPALLPKEAFFNDLKRENISDKQYSKLEEVCKTFGINTLLELAKFYCESDTLLLAEIMLQMRKICHQYFQLDMMQFLSLGSMSWEYMLKNTDVKLELTDNIDIWLFIEQAIQGGLSCVNQRRFAESHNRDIEGFNPNKLVNGMASALFYLDFKSLYGYCQWKKKMFEDSPRFLSDYEVSNFKLSSIIDDGPIGYLINCDLEIPAKTKEILRYCPILPQNRTIFYNDLSPHTKIQLDELGIKFPNGGVTRLIADLDPKIGITVQGNLLLFCVNYLGVRLLKINRILEFRQSNWLNAHVEQLLKYRFNHSDNKLLDKTMKLSLNALFGKSLENPRNYRSMRIVTNQEKFLDLSSRNNFRNLKILNSEAVLMEFTKTIVELVKPTIMGVQILNEAKFHNAKGVYLHMLPYFLGPDMKTWSIFNPLHKFKIFYLYMDTDSWVMLIYFPPHLHHYDCLKGIKHILDTTIFPKDHILYEHKEPLDTIGLLKIEGFPQKLLSCVLLKSKNYCMNFEGEDLDKKCKGATRESIKNLTLNDYLHCIDKNLLISADQHSIRSFNSQLYTVVIKKQILSCLDYKNYYFNSRECTQYGDPLIKKSKSTLGFKYPTPTPKIVDYSSNSSSDNN
jgi:hypothetical protein